jgi:hypothetical protein
MATYSGLEDCPRPGSTDASAAWMQARTAGFMRIQALGLPIRMPRPFVPT